MVRQQFLILFVLFSLIASGSVFSAEKKISKNFSFENYDAAEKRGRRRSFFI